MTIRKGTIKGTSIPATVLYAGRGSNRDWCFRSTLSTPYEELSTEFDFEEDTHDAILAALNTVDVAFVEDSVEPGLWESGPSFVRSPAWIKQLARVESDWARQVSSLKRSTRQGVSRALRKYGYTCEISYRANDAERFYEEMYRPYVESAFGASAIIVDRERFLRNCQRGALLQLRTRRGVLGAALLRPLGSTMSIVWTGMRPGDARAPAAVDTLDYFALLYAHLQGSRWLDFGKSRPDLCDGILRYKRKWGTEVRPCFFRQPPILWTCNTDTLAARRLLGQHAFISNAGNGLTALIFATELDSAAATADRLRRLATPGIGEYRIVSLLPIDQALQAKLRRDCPRATIIEASSVPAAIAVASKPGTNR